MLLIDKLKALEVKAQDYQANHERAKKDILDLIPEVIKTLEENRRTIQRYEEERVG